MSGLPQELFVANRQQLRDTLDAELIVVTANGQMQSSGSVAFPFHQDGNFLYLTGLDEPSITLVIDVKNNSEYIILPKHNDVVATFDGATDPAQSSLTSGITEYLSNSEGWLRLDATLAQASKVHVVKAPKPFIDVYNMFTNPSRARLNRKISKKFPKLEQVDIREDLARMRMIKKPSEIAAIREAVDISVDGHKYIAKLVATCNHEYELEAEFYNFVRQRGAKGHGYSPIVASGANACILHHEASSANVDKNKLLLVDMGAEKQHYSADITRTYCVNPKMSARQIAISEAVIDVQDYALSKMQVGTPFRDYEKMIEEYMGRVLEKLGIIETKLRNNIRKFYPHATSHFLGLDVHDAGDYNAEFSEGMVLTVEPGIYVPKESIGVRVEDNILITANGPENLSKNLPRHPSELASL